MADEQPAGTQTVYQSRWMILAAGLVSAGLAQIFKVIHLHELIGVPEGIAADTLSGVLFVAVGAVLGWKRIRDGLNPTKPDPPIENPLETVKRLTK